MTLERPTNVVMASASRSGINASDLQNYESGRGAMLLLHVTVTPGSGASLELQLETMDPTSGSYIQFTTFAPVVPLGTDSTFNFIVYPSEAGTFTAPDTQHLASGLPALWRAKVASEAGAFTYSCHAVFME